MSETLEPQEMVKFLNEYLTLMSGIVEKNQGIIVNSSAIPSWRCSGPLSPAVATRHSLQAALNMLWSLEEFNYRRAWEGKPPIRIGIGINTGPVVAGFMGTDDRLKYTVLEMPSSGLPAWKGSPASIMFIAFQRVHAEGKPGQLCLSRIGFGPRKRAFPPVRLFELWNRNMNRFGYGGNDAEVPERQGSFIS